MPKKTYSKTCIVVLHINELNPAEYNARLITDEVLDGLGMSLEHFGLLSFPVVNKRPDGYRIVGGHQRIKALKEKGITRFPCVVVEFDDEMEKAANLALNNRAIQGSFVAELTRNLLNEIQENLHNHEGGTFNTLRMDALLKSLPKVKAAVAPREEEREGRTDDDAAPHLTKSSVDSKAGRYYKMGEHVLFVGRAENVSLIKGFPVDRADMAFTRIAEKKTVTQEYLDLMVSRLLANTDGAVFIATNMLTLPHLQRQFIANGGHWSSTLMWYPPEPTGAADVAYREATLPVLYGWREGESHYFGSPRDSGDIIKLRKKAKSDVPVEVIVRCMLDGSAAKASILDLDVGRGSSVIAAEKVNRRVIGFVNTATEMDTVRKRWTDFTCPPGTNWKSVTSVYEGKS